MSVSPSVAESNGSPGKCSTWALDARFARLGTTGHAACDDHGQCLDIDKTADPEAISGSRCTQRSGLGSGLAFELSRDGFDDLFFEHDVSCYCPVDSSRLTSLARCSYSADASSKRRRIVSSDEPPASRLALAASFRRPSEVVLFADIRSLHSCQPY